MTNFRSEVENLRTTQEFKSEVYLVSDPSGNRFKTFQIDKTFKVPGRYGKIYDFNAAKVLVYSKFQNICDAYELEDINTAPFLLRNGYGFKFFTAMEQVWADPSFGKTQYLGQVRIKFGNHDGKADPEVYHLFVNNIQFFDAEMDFEKSSRSVRTLYFV